MGTPFKNQNGLRSQISWKWDFWWLRKTWTDRQTDRQTDRLWFPNLDINSAETWRGFYSDIMISTWLKHETLSSYRYRYRTMDIFYDLRLPWSSSTGTLYDPLMGDITLVYLHERATLCLHVDTRACPLWAALLTISRFDTTYRSYSLGGKDLHTENDKCIGIEWAIIMHTYACIL